MEYTFLSSGHFDSIYFKQIKLYFKMVLFIFILLHLHTIMAKTRARADTVIIFIFCEVYFRFLDVNESHPKPSRSKT